MKRALFLLVATGILTAVLSSSNAEKPQTLSANSKEFDAFILKDREDFDQPFLENLSSQKRSHKDVTGWDLFGNLLGAIALVVLVVIVTLCILLGVYKAVDYIKTRQLNFRNPAALSQIVLILGAIILLVFIFNCDRVEFRTGEAYGKGFAIVGATLFIYFALKGLEQSKDKSDNSKEDEDEIERQFMFIPTVDKDKCIGCGECIEVCPVEVFELEDEKAEPVNAEECLGCDNCVEVCEQEAITVEAT